MKNVLYMHAGSGNHGCEALVRTTAALLNGPHDVMLWSFAKNEDEKYGSAKCLESIIQSEEIPRFSPIYLEALVKRHLFRKPQAQLHSFFKYLFRKNIAVSIGGDNYCYPWSAGELIEWNKVIRKYAAFSVLWGCSIDPEAITPAMKEDLAGYDLITARESITYELLKSINPNTQLVTDPAFLLETTKLPLPKGFVENNTVGINVSPLVMGYATEGDLVLANYKEMVRYIIENTDMNVCLIPHVVWEDTDDRKPLQVLYDAFSATGRVCMVEDCNATELKGYIARCRFFVGARTHATIAAYSSYVPTLVVGYSVKSRGIAKDLFGEEEQYVLSVREMKDPDDLLHHFRWLTEHEDVVKKQLVDIMPEYKRRAMAGVRFFKSILSK